MIETLKRYLNGRRNSVEEKRLKSLVRKMDNQEKAHLLKVLVDEMGTAALIFIGSCTNQRSIFEHSFDHGLKYGNASSIKTYLEVFVRRMGPKLTLSHLISRLETNREGVENAIYWIPKYIDVDHKEHRHLYEDLLCKFKEKPK